MKSLVALVGLVAIVTGLVLGLGTIGSGGEACGSAFRPDYSQSALTDAVFADHGDLAAGYESDCRDEVSARKPWAFGGLGLGLILVLFAIALPGSWSIDPARPSTGGRHDMEGRTS